MARKLSAIGSNPLVAPLSIGPTPAPRPNGAARTEPAPERPRYRTKTLGWNDADQAVLDALRTKLAAAGRLLTERDVVAAALRAALRDPTRLTDDELRGDRPVGR